MKHSTHTTRASGAIAITALAGLFAIAPAFADIDGSEVTPADVRVYDAGGDIGAPAASGGPSPIQYVPVDDNALELVQIGLGVLAGMAVVAVGVTAANTARRHAPAHPA
jgi:hypothetical protein